MPNEEEEKKKKFTDKNDDKKCLFILFPVSEPYALIL